MYPYINLIIPSYAMMAFLGGILSICFVYIRLDETTVTFSCFLKIICCSILGIFIGSKIMFTLTQIPWLIKHFSFANVVMLIVQSGYVFYGGLFGMIFCLYILFRNNIATRKIVFDLVVPAMPLFHEFGRVGCFLSGCCYGRKLEMPLQIGRFVFERIPVQLIEAISELVIFGTILLVQKNKPHANVLRIYLITYAVLRFFDEFLRGDLIRGIWFGLSTA